MRGGGKSDDVLGKVPAKKDGDGSGSSSKRIGRVRVSSNCGGWCSLMVISLGLLRVDWNLGSAVSSPNPNPNPTVPVPIPLPCPW